MEFIDLKAQQKIIRKDIEAKIKKVLDHGKYIMGPEVGEVEIKLAGFSKVNHAITCSSGTDALVMALMALGIGGGDAVFTTPFTFIATGEAISLVGATPVFSDIDPISFNIDPEKLETTIKSVMTQDNASYPMPAFFRNSPLRPKAIIAVDLFGQPAEYDSINKIAKKYGLFVIGDGAQSFGAKYKGKSACSMADIACTSFFPAKPLGCYGDGGAIFTDDDRLAENLLSIRIHGKGSHKYENIRIGINGRMDTIQAAILLAKIKIFPKEIGLRQKAAENYTRLISEISYLTTPFVHDDMTSVWAQYSLLAGDEKNRDDLITKLKHAGIPTAIYYPKPLHLQGAFKHLGYKKGDFPVSENTAKRIFSLPMHPYLEYDNQRLIAEILAG